MWGYVYLPEYRIPMRRERIEDYTIKLVTGKWPFRQIIGNEERKSDCVKDVTGWSSPMSEIPRVRPQSMLCKKVTMQKSLMRELSTQGHSQRQSFLVGALQSCLCNVKTSTIGTDIADNYYRSYKIIISYIHATPYRSRLIQQLYCSVKAIPFG